MTIPQKSRLEKAKVETKKGNKLLQNTQTDSITELKELIHAGVKLICYKIGFPQRNPN